MAKGKRRTDREPSFLNGLTFSLSARYSSKVKNKEKIVGLFYQFRANEYRINTVRILLVFIQPINTNVHKYRTVLKLDQPL